MSMCVCGCKMKYLYFEMDMSCSGMTGYEGYTSPLFMLWGDAAEFFLDRALPIVYLLMMSSE